MVKISYPTILVQVAPNQEKLVLKLKKGEYFTIETVTVQDHPFYFNQV